MMMLLFNVVGFSFSVQRPYQKIESLQSSSSTNSVLLQRDNLINKGSGKIVGFSNSVKKFF